VKSKIDTNNAKPETKGKKKTAPSLSSLVRKKDRVKPAELIEYLDILLKTAKQVGDIKKAVGSITEKVLAWKQSHGDLDQQEKMIRAVFSNAEAQVVVHNIKTQMQPLSQIQEAIGLTQEEVIVILFTSLDQDYFTNLLISAGQFTEWFNLNFEGETQEEVDFKESQDQEWNAIIDMAQMVIQKHQQMVDNNYRKMDDILTQTWWSHARFSRVGNAIAEVFASNPVVQ
jgi:hypothetical protein